MSDTPRTDAELAKFYESEWSDFVHCDFARQLERELAECIATLDTALECLSTGLCSCEYLKAAPRQCHRCRVIDDIETTLKNCRP